MNRFGSWSYCKCNRSRNRSEGCCRHGGWIRKVRLCLLVAGSKCQEHSKEYDSGQNVFSHSFISPLASNSLYSFGDMPYSFLNAR